MIFISTIGTGRSVPFLPTPNMLYASRAKQISAKARVADRAVADNIDERGVAGHHGTFQGRAELLRPLDVLTVTTNELEHPTVALVR